MYEICFNHFGRVTVGEFQVDKVINYNHEDISRLMSNNRIAAVHLSKSARFLQYQLRVKGYKSCTPTERIVVVCPRFALIGRNASCGRRR